MLGGAGVATIGQTFFRPSDTHLTPVGCSSSVKRVRPPTFGAALPVRSWPALTLKHNDCSGLSKRTLVMLRDVGRSHHRAVRGAVRLSPPRIGMLLKRWFARRAKPARGGSSSKDVWCGSWSVSRLQRRSAKHHRHLTVPALGVAPGRHDWSARSPFFAYAAR